MHENRAEQELRAGGRLAEEGGKAGHVEVEGAVERAVGEVGEAGVGRRVDAERSGEDLDHRAAHFRPPIGLRHERGDLVRRGRSEEQVGDFVGAFGKLSPPVGLATGEEHHAKLGPGVDGEALEECLDFAEAALGVVDHDEPGDLAAKESLAPVAGRTVGEKAGMPALCPEALAPLDQEPGLTRPALARDEADGGGRVVGAPVGQASEVVATALFVEGDDFVGGDEEPAGDELVGERARAGGDDLVDAR